MWSPCRRLFNVVDSVWVAIKYGDNILTCMLTITIASPACIIMITMLTATTIYHLVIRTFKGFSNFYKPACYFIKLITIVVVYSESWHNNSYIFYRTIALVYAGEVFPSNIRGNYYQVHPFWFCKSNPRISSYIRIII